MKETFVTHLASKHSCINRINRSCSHGGPSLVLKQQHFKPSCPSFIYHWEPNHKAKCNQCGYLAETGVLRREWGGAQPQIAPEGWIDCNRSATVGWHSRLATSMLRMYRKTAQLVGVCKDDNVIIVFLPPLEEKTFIRPQNPFKGLGSPGKAHAKHRTQWHLNLPVEKKP